VKPKQHQSEDIVPAPLPLNIKHVCKETSLTSQDRSHFLTMSLSKHISWYNTFVFQKQKLHHAISYQIIKESRTGKSLQSAGSTQSQSCCSMSPWLGQENNTPRSPHTRAHAHTHAHTYTHIHAYKHTHIHIHIYTHTHKHTYTQTHTNTHVHRHTDTLIHTFKTHIQE
jgi:hypothetical protein